MIKILNLILFVLNAASFTWSMKCFFRVNETSQKKPFQIFLVIGVLFALADLYFLITAPEVWIAQLAGFFLYLLSAIVFWWAISTNRKKPLTIALSTDQPQHLVHTGPYQFVRHPFYTAYLLFWLASPVATLSLWLVPTVIILYFLYWHTAKGEEAKFAQSPLAAEYARYSQKTGRFFPKLMGPGATPK